jgi:hypothetical protein
MEQELILSVVIGVVFFIVKLITIRLNSKISVDEKTDQQRTVFRDSVMVIFISAISMFAKKEFFGKGSGKTPVFTNEPGF